MAITFVSEVSVVIPTGSSTTSVSLPSGLQEGDVLISIAGCDFFFDDHGISGQGWITIDNPQAVATGVEIKYKVMGATPDTTVDVTEDAIRKIAYIIQAFRGVDNTNVQDTAFQSTTGNSASADPPSITTITDNALVIAAGILDDLDSTVSSFPSGYSNTSEINTSAGFNTAATVAVASKIITPDGAEDPGAFVFNDSEDWAAYSIALRPGAPPEGTNMQINIGDVWKEVPAIQINIGDVWKEVVGIQQNIGDVWKEVF